MGPWEMWEELRQSPRAMICGESRVEGRAGLRLGKCQGQNLPREVSQAIEWRAYRKLGQKLLKQMREESNLGVSLAWPRPALHKLQGPSNAACSLGSTSRTVRMKLVMR